MRVHLLMLTLAIIMSAITVLGILTAPHSELGILTKLALWSSLGVWFATVRTTIANIGSHRRITSVERLMERAKALMDTARMYSEMGMATEAIETATEGERLSNKASRLLDGKGEEECQEENSNDTSSSSDGT